jgi:hypothetical protein
MKSPSFVIIPIFIYTTLLASNENFPAGARAAALGNASAALSDVWSAAHNQAGLGFVRNTCAGMYYESRFLIKELSTRSAVLAIPLKTGTLGLSFSDFGYTLYKESKYTLSFAKVFSKNFSVGMAVDYLNTRIAEGAGNFSAIVGEIGMQTKLSKNLVIGAHLYNPTRSRRSRNTNERIQSILRLGIGYSFSSSVFLAAETEKDISQKATFRAGMEYQPLHNFYLRIGISTEPVLTTFGLGMLVKNFQIDLSVHYHQTLGVTPQLGFTYLFTKSDKTVRDGN